MRFHALRHSAATLLMAEGVPVKVTSEMLGHADITTTLRIYSHVLPSMQEAAANAMDRLFKAPKTNHNVNIAYAMSSDLSSNPLKTPS